eukprot:evm.model.scf_299.3 EVM.evm.TU.scf_299.3   scf_299:18512-30111(+)
MRDERPDGRLLFGALSSGPTTKGSFLVEGTSASSVRLGHEDWDVKPSRRCRWPRCRWWCLLLLVAAIVAWIVWATSRSNSRRQLPVVKVAGTQFEANCRPLYLSGFNSHDLIQAALMTPHDYSLEGGKAGKERIKQMFSQAAGAGLNVVRTWAHTNDKQFPFQEKPGKYNKNGLKALDYIIDQARRHGIYVILSMIDNWKYYNGVDQYVDWSSTVPKRTRERPSEKAGDPVATTHGDEAAKNYEVERHMLFFNDSGARTMYKNHFKTIANRKNTANGMLYKEDPTILAYDLINEPRCETWRVPECNDIMQAWIEEMSAFVKSVDPDHLVTIGSDGFFGGGSQWESANPQEWAKDMGQNFTRNHLAPHIDFAAIHIWPDNWNRTDADFETRWLNAHIEAAATQLGKPVLLEEFGKKLEGDRQDSKAEIQRVRDPVYNATYAVVEDALKEQSPMAGSLFWRWNMPLFRGKGRGPYGVRPGDSTFKFVKQDAQFVKRLTNSRPPRKECSLGCWVKHEGKWGGRQCVDRGGECDSLLEGGSGDRGGAVDATGTQVFPTKEACCDPDRGAFSNGCSWL